MRRTAVLLAALALIATACGSGSRPNRSSTEPTVFPVVASTDLAVGDRRLLVALYDDQTRSLASPDLEVEMELRAPDGQILTAPGQFVWTIPEVRGLYRAEVELDRAGEWAVVLHPESHPPTDPAAFLVKGEPATVMVGEPVPLSDTPTLDDTSLEQLTTDPDPDPRLYHLSIEEAVTSGLPTVVVFATPAFCSSQVCGPTLELIKEQLDRYPDVHFVHVEVYDLDLTPEELEPVASVLRWGLPSEPWVFVVDREGALEARFEGVVTAAELAEALEAAGA